MRQVFLQRGKVQLNDIAIPLENENNIIVKVHYSFISTGTEGATLVASGKSLFGKFAQDAQNHAQKVLGALKENGVAGTIALIKDKINQIMPLGYSCAGQVVHAGKNVTKFRVGDYVACAGASYAHHADLVTIPQNLAVKIYDPEILKHASFTTIGSIALQGIRRANLQIGETVCILGLGLIGQITLQLAKLAGCRVIAADLVDYKVELAQQFGVDYAFNAQSYNLVEQLAFATAHRGADVTIITASSETGRIIDQAMQVTRRKGKVVLVGDVKIDFSRDQFYAKEIDFLISCSYGPGRYDFSYEAQGNDYPFDYVRWTENRNMEYFIKLLEDKKINIQPLISHEFDLNRVQEAYECLQKSEALGIVLSYSSSHHEESIDAAQEKLYEPETIKPFIRTEKKIRVGVIGAGGFAKIKLLPIVSHIKNCHIHTIIDADAATTINVARQYSSHRINNDYRKILSDDDINVVIIATPHALHLQQTIDCLAAGKAVFCEKPAVVTMQQLEHLHAFLTQHPDVVYSVDFNRPFSPFMQKVKFELKNRSNPIQLIYRMNAGYLNKSHWIQSNEHGGRIIGEACHIFELFCFLTDAQPVSVAVACTNSREEDIATHDNFAAHITMSDGSLCSLIYTSLGNTQIGKEYMEIFFDGKTIKMNDFYELTGYGLPVTFNTKASSQDKGHESLINAFFNTIKTTQTPLPIPFDRIIAASEISILVDRLARQGGGFELLNMEYNVVHNMTGNQLSNTV